MAKRKRSSKGSRKTRTAKGRSATRRRPSRKGAGRKRSETSAQATARPEFGLEQEPWTGSAPAARPPAARRLAARPPAPVSPLLQVFEGLAAILVPYARVLPSEMHPTMGYCLKATQGRPAQELYFGAVKLHPDHACYHLFLLYAYPDLEPRMSPALRGLLDGKTSFRIERYDRALFAELERLTKTCFERFQAQGLQGSGASDRPPPSDQALAL